MAQNPTKRTSRPLNLNVPALRIMLAILISGICLFNLFITYRGLDQPEAMDQAQIARNVAQGRGFTSQFLRPIDVVTADKRHGRKADFNLGAMTDSNNAPLNVYALAAALKMTGYDRFEEVRMQEDGSPIYGADRVVSAVSTVFFILSLVLSYILTRRLFDDVVACTTVVLMGLSERLLAYAVSGLPQPLMMCCFLGAMLCLHSAIAAEVNGRSRAVLLYLAGSFVCTALLCLSGWMGLWVAFGLLVFCGFYFRPLGRMAIFGAVVLVAILYFPLNSLTASAGGITQKFFTALYGCFGQQDASDIMRTTDLGNTPFNNAVFFLRLLGYSFVGLDSLYVSLGSIFVTPFFFLAMFNRYRNKTTQGIKWAAFAAWLTSCVGMALFGTTSAISGSQLMVLFTPLFTAFGLALMFNFLGRMDLGESYRAIRGLAIFFVVLISSGMYLFKLPNNLHKANINGAPMYPPYYPPALNLALEKITYADRAVLTDQPWAVAWYADRPAVWLPKLLREWRDDLEPALKRGGLETQGVLITPTSHSMLPGGLRGISSQYGDFMPLVSEGKLLQYAPNHNLLFADLFNKSLVDGAGDDNIASLASSTGRFDGRNYLMGADIMYYTTCTSLIDLAGRTIKLKVPDKSGTYPECIVAVAENPERSPENDHVLQVKMARTLNGYSNLPKDVAERGGMPCAVSYEKTGKATAELILSRCAEDGSREVLGEFHLVYTSPFGGRYVGITKDTKDMSAAPVRFEGSFELTRRPAECVHVGGK